MGILNYTQFLKESEEERDYSFDELSPEAKKHAIDSNRDYSIEGYDWWDGIIEGFVEDMEEIGLENVDPQFSGFYSQGDGASFTARVRDNEKFLNSIGLNPIDSLTKGKIGKEKVDKAIKELAENIYITIQRNDNRHYHHNTVSANVEVDGEDEIELDLGIGMVINIDVQAQCDLLEPKITEWARSRSQQLYRDLETYFEELQSDENIEADLKSGGHRFDAEGNMV